MVNGPAVGAGRHWNLGPVDEDKVLMIFRPGAGVEEIGERGRKGTGGSLPPHIFGAREVAHVFEVKLAQDGESVFGVGLLQGLRGERLRLVEPDVAQ